jgi:hypothetical protein
MTPYASGEPDPTRPPAAQVSAAIAVLDRAWGRPHQALEVGISRASLEDFTDRPRQIRAGAGNAAAAARRQSQE